MTSQPRSRFFYGYVVTAAGFAIWFIGGGTYTPSFSVFLKPMVEEFGWLRAEASLGYSLSMFVSGILSFGMGWLTDRIGPRGVMMGLGSFLGICYILMSRIETLWQFQLNYAVLGGIGASTIIVPVMATISRWFVRRRGWMLGIVQAGLGVGGFLFPPFAGWLILSYGWRNAYLITGILTLLGMTLAGAFLRRDPQELGLLPDDHGPCPIPRTGHSPVSAGAPRGGVREQVKHRSFWMIVGIFGIFGFCRTAFLSHVTAHVQDLGFSLVAGANVLAVINGVSVAGRIGIGRIADTLGNVRTFMMSFAVTTLSLIVGWVAQDLWAIYLFAFLFGLGWGTQAVLRFSLSSQIFGVASLGVILGLFSMAEAGGAAFGSYVAGWLFDLYGNYQVVFCLGIALSLAAVFLVRLLRPVAGEVREKGRP